VLVIDSVGRHRSISANLHTAPPPRAFLARVKEVEHPIAAFANLRSIEIGEYHGDAVCNRTKQILGFTRTTIRLGLEPIVGGNQSCPHGVVGYDAVGTTPVQALVLAREITLSNGFQFRILRKRSLPGWAVDRATATAANH
jgi:hypothetical protein